MTTYPFLVYLLAPGKFLTKAINFVPASSGRSNLPGITIRCRISPYDDRGELVPEVRSLICRFGHEEQVRTGMLVCAVYGAEDCDYLAPDGTPFPSSDPPKLGKNQLEERPSGEALEELALSMFVEAAISAANAESRRKNETIH